jgi:hypothetical protein
MIESPYDSCARSIALLNQYSFDLADQTTEQVIIEWLTEYPPNWIDLAVIEALYQGRYKAVSARQILSLWQRRGKPTYHFTVEFEQLVCQSIPQKIISENDDFQDSSEVIDDLNNPAKSSPEFDTSMGEIILRPLQTIVVPIQYPNFFDKLKALVEIGSDFLSESNAPVEPVDVIDVPTVETSKIVEDSPHQPRKFEN